MRLFLKFSAYPSVNLCSLRTIHSWTQTSSVYIRNSNRLLIVRDSNKCHIIRYSKIPLIAIITSHRTISDWSKLFGLTKSLNLNIASYLVSTLVSPNENTWHHRCGTIIQTIDRFGINPNHWRSVENTWKTVIGCIERMVKYTGRNGTKHYARPYLVNYYIEINMLEG